MTPHGSQLKEWTRFLANKFLSDKTRRAIKRFIELLRLGPLYFFGVKQELDGYRQELERLKARVNHLDGKIKFTLHGTTLPKLGDASETKTQTNP